MPDPPHSFPTGRADRYAGPSSLSPTGRPDLYTEPSSIPSSRPYTESYAGPSLISNPPCSPLCRIFILSPHQPAALTFVLDPSHSLPTGRADRYAGSASFHFNRPCSLLCRTILTPLHQAVLTDIRAPLTPFQPAVLIVMPDHSHSTPTARADRYAGPSSLHSNRPCSPLCRTLLIPFKPAVLTAIPDHPYSLQTAVLIVIPNHPHSPPAGGADSYAVPSSLPFNRSY